MSGYRGKLIPTRLFLSSGLHLPRAAESRRDHRRAHETLGQKGDDPKDPTYAQHMKDAQFLMPSPHVLQNVVDLPSMTGVQYEKKVRDYLSGHRDHLVIERLRGNVALTATDLDGLERTLAEIGEADGPKLLSALVERSGAPSLAWFVRGLVGMDRPAAQAAFAGYLGDRSLNAAQIRFVELIVDQLTARGVMEPAALYEAPFSDLHAGGPEGLFAGRANVIEGVFSSLEQAHEGVAPAARVG